MRGELDNCPDISFIDGISFEDFLNEMIENYERKYEEITGEKISLAPASPKRLELYSCAVMIYQGLQYVDRNGKKGLLKYSTGKYLDHLAAMKRVERNKEKVSKTTLKFIVSKPQQYDIEIPKGTRAKGKELFFATSEAAVIKAGAENTEVAAECLQAGEIGNGLNPGEINILVDPINYVSAVINISRTTGGTDEESDDSLAEKTYYAPSGYSTGGTEDAYRYLVKSYSQAVEDCYITSENPGEVDIYILLQNGEIPNEAFLQGLADYLKDKKKKVLTDYIQIRAPEINEYEIEVTYYISDNDSGREERIKESVEKACENYREWQQGTIGRDLNPSQLMYRLIQAGACYAVIQKPEWKEITTAVVSKAKSVNLQYGGLKDERTI